MIVWKKYANLEVSKLHAFVAMDETVSLCGRDDLTPGYRWVNVNTTAVQDLDIFKCKMCVSLIQNPGKLSLPRRHDQGEGMAFSPRSLP